MFKLLGWIFKATLFTVAVLVASHLIRWNGRTVSDQVRSSLSNAERSSVMKTVKKKSKAVMNSAGDVASDVADRARSLTATEILEKDKAELQALIHDENAKGE